MASLVEILVVVNLFFALTSNPSMEFRIFLVIINLAIFAAGTMRRNRESTSTSSSSSGINYEVFLSFRGGDTRQGFTDHLYDNLTRAGIKVFKDDKELPAGRKITSELKEAIKRSKISIAIFSKDYASSRSCLMEVEQMWDCRELDGQTIIPIFYDISPFDVKRQAGDFKTSFENHKEDGVNAGTIKTWKNVLRQIGGLSGYDRGNRHEAELVKEVVRHVKRVLKKDDQFVTDRLVGIDHHAREVMRNLGAAYSDGEVTQVSGEDVRVIGICGMQGFGKTTLAKVVFNKIHKFFDACSFLEDINSKGVERSQQMLISDLQQEEPAPLKSLSEGITKMKNLFNNMKVLIVLDDVREVSQIKALAEELAWFGRGSKIIVTTCRKDVLKIYGDAVEQYKVEPMRDNHALELFHRHAFPPNAPHDVSEYNSLSPDIIKVTGGIPLAVVLLANKFKEKGITIWKSTLDCLKDHPLDDPVEAAFMESYKCLDEYTKEIFLDIACFFIGKDERIPSYMWQACRYYPPKGIDSLRGLHLLEDGENNELRMHNLLRDFGRKIVERKAVHQRCRFWNHSDALSIVKDGQLNESVQGISLTVEEGGTVRFTCEELGQKSKLRYLRLDGANIRGESKNLLPNLRWLDWRPHGSIPELGNMDLKKLVILDLSESAVTRDSLFLEKVEELKVLNLQGCSQIRASLNFPAPINLELLILEGCNLLHQIGPSISNLKTLSSLNLRKCKLVKQLPQKLGSMNSLKELLIDETGIEKIVFQKGSLENLEILSACDCQQLKDISTIGHLSNLSSLVLDGTANVELPHFFEFPRKLRRLSLRKCTRLGELPTSIGELKQLEVMDLSHTGITKLPSSVKELTNLKTLKMARTFLQKFPEEIMNLPKLEEIDFSLCRSLASKVRFNISGLSSLRILRLQSSYVAGLPRRIGNLSHLQALDILDCNQLHALPELPSSLLSLRWGSEKMGVSDLSYLTNLKELVLKDVMQPKAGRLMSLLNLKTAKIGWITRLPSLETLELSLPTVTYLPRNFSALTQLQKLSLSYMKEPDLTQLPSSSLLTLHLKHCEMQEPKFSSLTYLSELELDNCNIAKIDVLEDLKLLEVLKISQRSSILNLNGLKELRCLRKVQVIPFDPASLSELSECTFELDPCG
ncbi:hypothetical protein ACJRO7_015375 [Eucalyptus globulus]|uniref:TIR domain-containing protein n=1 Tax=Eucalyptus globulus TaxID=34317 RepID=A0ABD3L945_EUCGL